MHYRISDFWARTGALIIDWICIWALGYLLGLIFKDFFISLGRSGPIIGMGIVTVYFTVADSYLTKGRTIGKKILNIQVIKASEEFLTLKESFLRTTILYAPFFILKFRITGIPPGSIQYLIIYGLAISVLLGILLIFIVNKRNRQSLHDLIVGSYVTKTIRDDEYNEIKPVKKSLLFLTGSGVLLCAIALSAIVNQFFPPPNNVEAKWRNIEKIPGVISASIYENHTTFIKNDTKVTSAICDVSVWLQSSVTSIREDSILANSVAQIILDDSVSIREFDFIDIGLIRGFDIGIARMTHSRTITRSPGEWLSILNAKTDYVSGNNPSASSVHHPGTFADGQNNEMAETYNQLGDTSFANHEYQRAINQYTKSIELDPGKAKTWKARGFCKYLLQDYGGAISDYTQAINLDSLDPETYILRGHARYNLNDTTEAETDFEKANELKY